MGAKTAPQPYVSSVDATSAAYDTDLSFGIAEMQSVARRQLVGSIIAGLAVAVVAGLTALRPNHPETSYAAVHIPVVQQPVIVHPERHLASSRL